MLTTANACLNDWGNDHGHDGGNDCGNDCGTIVVVTMQRCAYMCAGGVALGW